MSQISDEQRLEIKAIVSKYENFKCVECAQAIKDYLISQGIEGKHIKLFTGSQIGRNSLIYDDSVPNEAISENGIHEAIVIILNGVEVVFDNHHPDGLPREEWMSNLQFHDRIFRNLLFQVTESEF